MYTVSIRISTLKLGTLIDKAVVPGTFADFHSARIAADDYMDKLEPYYPRLSNWQCEVYENGALVE